MRRRGLPGSLIAAVLLVIGTISAAQADGPADLGGVRSATAKLKII
jgi:hypothetical protein